jgi:hypothetical protein
METKPLTSQSPNLFNKTKLPLTSNLSFVATACQVLELPMKETSLKIWNVAVIYVVACWHATRQRQRSKQLYNSHY